MEIDNRKLIISLVLVFVLGILFAVVNGYYVSDSGEQLPIIVYVISFISVLIGAFIVVMFQWKINKVQLERILKILPAEERRIVRLLMENSNAMEQNKIVAYSGYNKVKVTRVLQKLIERDAIEKRSLGNTNLVILRL